MTGPSEAAWDAAAACFAEGYRLLDSLPVEDAARAAWTPTGPALAELEARIRARRATQTSAPAVATPAPRQERATMAIGDDRLPDRFWSKISVDAASGCWTWSAGRNNSGYGHFSVAGRPVLAHRIAYAALAGEACELQLDHLCRNRACCNPAHLEPVTNRENSLRSPHRGSKTHCAQGHEYVPENTRWSTGRRGNQRRNCRTCDRARDRLRDRSVRKTA